MKKTLLLLSAFVASLVTFAQTNLTSGRDVVPLGGLKEYTKNDNVTKTTVSEDDLRKITSDDNTDNVYLFPEGGYNTTDNTKLGIQGFYIDLGATKKIGAITSTWEGAHAAGNIYVTNNEPGSDGVLSGETLIGTFTKEQGVKKGIAVSGSGRYVVFVPTDAVNFDWGVKIRTFAAFEEAERELTSLEVTPAMVKVGEATEMKFVAKDKLGIEITEGVSYTVANATWNGTTLTADNAGEITVTATYNGKSVIQTIVATDVSAPKANPTEPEDLESNVIAVYSAKYGKGLTDQNSGWGVDNGAPNPLYSSLEEVEIVDGHKVVHVVGTGFSNRTQGSVVVDKTKYNTIHVAVYPFTATKAKIFGDNDYTTAITKSDLVPGQWNYITVENESVVKNYVLIELEGESEFYLDHFYFVKRIGSFTIAKACTDGKKYYSTFYTDKAYEMPEDVEGQTVSVDADKLVVTRAYTAGDIVPANTPLLMCSDNPGEKVYTVTKTEGKPVGENMLHCGNEANWEEAGVDYLYYRLTMHGNDGIGFWWGNEKGAKFDLDGNKAYLAVPQTVTIALVRGFGFDGDATAISNVKAEAAGEDVIYDLSGRRVIAPVKAGIYIVNGKKMVIK